MTFFLKSSFKRGVGIKDMKVTGMFLNFLQLKRACKSYFLYNGQQNGLQGEHVWRARAEAGRKD